MLRALERGEFRSFLLGVYRNKKQKKVKTFINSTFGTKYIIVTIPNRITVFSHSTTTIQKRVTPINGLLS